MSEAPLAGAAPLAIEIRDLVKRYRRTSAGFQLRTLKSALLTRTLTAGLRDEETIKALDGLDLDVYQGEAFGVIGGNGSGKSTLLKILAGLVRPTSGRVRVDGRVAALIELGAGFHPEISGRENVFINGAVLGLSRREIERRFDDIVAFSGLGDFLDEPVKNYSSGMYVRLGFAVAIHTDPDVLVVDEVLSVGDEAFGHRCVRRIEEHLAAGRTLLVVSHGLDLVEQLCDRVLWLDRGTPRMVGEPRRVIDAYRADIAEQEGEAHREEKDREAAEDDASPEDDGQDDKELRWGSREAVIRAARLLVEGEERYHLETGERVVFELEVESRDPLDDFVFGVAVSTPRGIECWGTNTDLAGLEPGLFDGTATVQLVCPSLRLAPGEYDVDVAVHAEDGAPYDYRRRLLRFTVRSTERGVGVYFPEHEWQVEGAVQWDTSSTAPPRSSAPRSPAKRHPANRSPADSQTDSKESE